MVCYIIKNVSLRYSMRWFCLLFVTFKLSCFVCIQSRGEVSCDDVLSSTNGILVSLNYSNIYLNKMDCNITINVSNAILIEVAIDVLFIQSGTDYNLMNEMCLSNYLEISANEESFKLCGNWVGKEHLLFFTFNASVVRVKFHTIADSTKPRFKLRWYATPEKQHTHLSAACALSLLENERSCYEVIPEPARWEASRDICREKGAVLAQIEDESIHKVLEENLHYRNLSFMALWIGAHDQLYEGEYMWTDRSIVGFKNWFPGWLHDSEYSMRGTVQPSDDGFSNEDCVEIRRQFSYPGKGTGLTSSYYWNDRDCLVKNPFICQHDKVQRMRMKRYAPVDCGGLYNLTSEDSSLIIASPGFPSNYPRLVSCHVIINAPFGNQLDFSFEHMHIEGGVKGCGFDNLTLADMAYTGGQNSVTHCGDWNNKRKLLRWSSETNHAILAFHTDYSKEFTGFKVNVVMVNKGDKCKFDGQPDWIYGPLGCWQYNETPSNYTEATTLCEASGGRIAEIDNNIQFAGEMLNHHHTNISCVNLWTHHATTPSHTSSAFSSGTCRNTNICFKGTSGTILPEFEPSVAEVPCSNQTAFMCIRTAKDPEYQYISKNFTSSSGNIGSLCNYSNNAYMTYSIQANNENRILIEISGYDIEFQELCLYDSLTIYNSERERRICGKSQEKVTVLSQNSSIIVHFMSDNDVTGCGFNISWQWIPWNKTFDAPDVMGESGFVSSVNFPHSYPDHLDGCHVIRAPVGHMVLLEFLELALPGDGCQDSFLEIHNTANPEGIKLCGGSNLDEMAVFQALFLSLNNTLTICLKASSLGPNQGFRANFVFTTNATLKTSLFIRPGGNISIASVMFPYGFPSNSCQDVELVTELGYSLSIDSLEIMYDNDSNCGADILSVLDLSLLAKPSDILYSVSCLNESRSAIYNIPNSFLNVLKINLRSGYHSNKFSAMQFLATVSSVKDSEMLKKTIRTQGPFVGCHVDTCDNGGHCSHAELNRSTCECQPQYTGLFCQNSMCDLRPCRHGNCNLTSDGFVCKCNPSYWGERCEMDSALCRWKLCASHGSCVSLNDTQAACLCDAGWTGPRCEEMIPVVPESLTIGQKLLKEPIWIGMIVILNLVLFFCLLYIVRRKCGRKLAQFLPKKTKTTVSTLKEESRTETSVSSHYLDIPRAQSASATPKLQLYRSPRTDQTPVGSGPVTPEIDEQNREAAFKMFESYKSDKRGLTSSYSASDIENKVMMKSHVTDFRSDGLPDGKVSFSEGETGASSESTQGIIRSYTISTGVYDMEKRRNKHNKLRRGVSVDIENGRGIAEKVDINGPNRGPNHCFPEIKVLNENNIEEKACSDSDSDIVIHRLKIISDNVSPLKEKPLEQRRSSECIDSGYPSTAVSSSNTNPNTQLDSNQGTRKMSTSAVERRKLYRSKTKSSSFYNITASDHNSETDVARGYYSLPEKTKSEQLSLSDDLIPHEVDRYHDCSDSKYRLYVNTRYNRGAVSCDSDVENMSRKHNWTDTAIGSRRHSRHYRHAPCSCEIHRCNSTYSYRGTNGCTSCKPCFSTASASKYFSSGNVRQYFNRSSERISSSESEGFQRPRRHARCKRKLYRDRHARSSFRTKNEPASLYQQRRIARDFNGDEPYKATMLRSFLSDTVQNKTESDTLEQSYHRISPSELSGKSHNNSVLPSRNTSTHSTISNSSNSKKTSKKCANNITLVDLESIDPNIDIDDNECRGEEDKAYNSSFVLSPGPNTYTQESFFKKPFKDSAYQTKQSSVDKFTQGLPKDASKGLPVQKVLKVSEINGRAEDKVKRHLHQAALKLAMFRRIQAKEHFSKDSAIHTFSEDDLSIDEPDNKHGILVKRTSGSLLALQMKEMNLSRVTEELSCLSRDTNTPTNELQTDLSDKTELKSPPGFLMTDLNRDTMPASIIQNLAVEETIV